MSASPEAITKATKSAAKKAVKTPVTKPAKVAKKAPKQAVPAAEGVGLAGTIAKYRDQYVKGKTADGKTTIDNGDEVAELLRGKDLEQTYAVVAKQTKTPIEELKTKYQHLNVGQQRMNLGNRLRKVLRDKAAAAAA
jgi:hypothetical protein